mgnify:CR=1 FL=1
MESKRESILQQKEEAELKVQQYQHRIQLLENRKKHLEKKADKQRTHHLCNMGGAFQRSRFFDDSRVLLIDGTGLCFTSGARVSVTSYAETRNRR